MPKSIVKDPNVCNSAALRKATRRVTQLYDSVLAPCGLRSSQRSILLHISRAGDPTMTDLARAIVLDRSALAHNMKPLERDGYVIQIRDDQDGRSKRMRLTPLGRRKLTESTRLWHQAQKKFEAAYGVDRAASLRAALADIFSDDFTAAFNSL